MAPLAAVGLAALLFFSGDRMTACPYCGAPNRTYSEEFDSMSVVVFAKLVSAPPPSPAKGSSADIGAEDELIKSRFEVKKVLKGASLLGDSKTIETLYFGEPKIGQTFLIMASDPPKLAWTAPLPISSRIEVYLTKLTKLPKDNTRLEQFLPDLEDAEEFVARDSYDEFAKAPYEDLQKLKAKLPHAKLVEWIKNSDGVVASRRRLYLVMLSICGSKADVPLLESMIKSEDRKVKAGLDAMIGCYLTLEGETGLKLIEDLYLKNPKSDYADTYAAIMAIRVLGTELQTVPKEKLVKSLHCMLDRPPLADLVIPDLARWEDWSVIDRLVDLFKKADDKSNWVRVPVINYLQACPLPEAKKQLDVLSKLDPDAFKRASSFFFPGGGAPATPKADPNKASQANPKGSDVQVAARPVVGGGDDAEPVVAESEVQEASAKATRTNSKPEPMNLAYYFGVPILAVGSLAGGMWLILTGAGQR